VDLDGHELGVGIGIDSGQISFGEFGRAHRDLTAIGTVVNTAARAQSAAEAGQILVTETVCDRAPLLTSERQGQDYDLKGFENPVRLFAV
jgi:class 3 adenylate cyclase